MLERRDVGHRVVVRRRVGVTAAGRPLLTDLLGELVDLDDDRASPCGPTTAASWSSPAADVVAAKRVPPRPVRYSAMAELERIADAAWPAPVHERLGGWYLRAADGWTNRANSALPARRPRLAAARGVRSPAGPGTGPAASRPGSRCRCRCDATWPTRSPPPAGTRSRSVLVQTAALADILAAVPAEAAVEPDREPSEEFIRVVAARKQSLPAAAHHVLTAVPAVRFAEVRSRRLPARPGPRRGGRADAAHRAGRGRPGRSPPRPGPAGQRRARPVGGRARRRPGGAAGRGGQRRRGTRCTRGWASRPTTATSPTTGRPEHAGAPWQSPDAVSGHLPNTAQRAHSSEARTYLATSPSVAPVTPRLALTDCSPSNVIDGRTPWLNSIAVP